MLNTAVIRERETMVKVYFPVLRNTEVIQEMRVILSDKRFLAGKGLAQVQVVGGVSGCWKRKWAGFYVRGADGDGR